MIVRSGSWTISNGSGRTDAGHAREQAPRHRIVDTLPPQVILAADLRFRLVRWLFRRRQRRPSQRRVLRTRGCSASSPSIRATLRCDPDSREVRLAVRGARHGLWPAAAAGPGCAAAAGAAARRSAARQDSGARFIVRRPRMNCCRPSRGLRCPPAVRRLACVRRRRSHAARRRGWARLRASQPDTVTASPAFIVTSFASPDARACSADNLRNAIA